MSCEACENAQVPMDTTVGPRFFVRVGEANVELVGCPEHCGMVVHTLREATDVLTDLALCICPPGAIIAAGECPVHGYEASR